MLKPCGLFHTPESATALQDYIDALPGGDVKVMANTIFGMTWNLCAELTKGAVHKDAAFMLQYLARGIDYLLTHAGADDSFFNEWLNDSGDLERTYWIQDVAIELEKALPELVNCAWSDVCYAVVEHDLAKFIVDAFVDEAARPAISEVVELFKKKVESLNAKR